MLRIVFISPLCVGGLAATGAAQSQPPLQAPASAGLDITLEEVERRALERNPKIAQAP